MKGNLSKKKGFLGKLEGEDLSSIADILEVKYGERLDKVETDIDDMFEEAAGQIEDVGKKTSNNAEEIGEIWNDMGTMTEAFENRIVGVEGRVAEAESGLTEKEDVSNKIMVADDDGTYWSAAMTDMKTYQTIEEHIVQDLNEPREDRIPSVKAVSEAVKGIKPDIDLSDYFTKEETTRMIDVAISNVYGAIESEVKIINKEKENVSNKANIISNNGSNSEKYPSTKAVYEYGQGIVQASETYTEAYVAQEIGNIETALEEIIEKYGLGGDAT